MNTIEKFETTSGTVWTKERQADGTIVHRKGGSFAKQQSYAAAATHRDQTYVRDGQSEPDRPSTVPVPADDGGVDYVDCTAADARAIGRRIQADDEDLLPGQDTYTLPNGESYTIDELAGAFIDADQGDAVVRYAI